MNTDKGAPENLVGNVGPSGASDVLRDRLVPGPEPLKPRLVLPRQDGWRPENQGYQGASPHKALSSPTQNALGRSPVPRSAPPLAATHYIPRCPRMGGTATRMIRRCCASCLPCFGVERSKSAYIDTPDPSTLLPWLRSRHA